MKKFFTYLESSPLTFKSFLPAFLTILLARFIVESFFLDLKNFSFESILGSFFHGVVLFFTNVFLSLILLLWFFTNKSLREITSLLLWVFWFIIFPPIIDVLILGPDVSWSFYLFDGVKGFFVRYFTFFGDNYYIGITLGTRLMVLGAVVFFGTYLWLNCKKKSWAILGTLLIYTLFFVWSAMPSFFTWAIYLFKGEAVLALTDRHVAEMFLSPLRFFGVEGSGIGTALHDKMSLIYSLVLFMQLLFLQFVSSRKKFWALLKNIRFPQMIFNGGLLCVGVGLGAYYFRNNFEITFFSGLGFLNLVLAVFCGWFFSVLVNDLMDIKIDQVTNKNRPLVKKQFSVQEYGNYAAIFFLLALFFSLVVGLSFFMLIVFYLLITWVYSVEPFRFKKYVLVSSFVSAVACLVILVMGYVVISTSQSLDFFPWRIALFFFFSYVIMIPIKDLKDIEGDKKEGIVTLPVVLGEKNSRTVFAALLFGFYFFSVVVVKEKGLAPFALLFGTFSYWLLNNPKLKSKDLPWWVLAAVITYGAISVKIIF